MSDGLANRMVYGSGEGQNTKHYYAGTINKPRKKSCEKKRTKKKGK